MPHQKHVLIFLLVTLLFFMACGEQEKEIKEPKPASLSEENPKEKVFHVFSFDGIRGFRYMMHFDGPDNGATIFTQDEVRHLALIPTASGTKYADDRLMVWVKGEDIIFEVDGKRVGPCKVSGLHPILAKAWLTGTTFWAVGSEPGWNLLMGEDRVVVASGLQPEDVRRFPALTKNQLNPQSPTGVYEFQNDDSTLIVEISEGLCTNIMSGEPFPYTVKLTVNDKEMSGCGTGLF